MDINCDMGESYGQHIIGNDALIIPLVDTCNIACGFHGGDPITLETTIKAAVDQGKKIFAHPSYQDLEGFGRRPMEISTKELRAITKYQIGAVKSITESHGGKMSGVKPHGALYHKVAHDVTHAEAFIEAMLSIDDDLSLIGLAGSSLLGICESMHVHFIPEAFADRRYEQDGTLADRAKPNAVINDIPTAVRQVISIYKKNKVQAISGEYIDLNAKTICVHGDHPNAVALLKEIRYALPALKA